MIKMKEYIRTLISSILAGIWIGIGGTIYLLVDNQIIGAMLFSVGLLAICSFNLSLYTGKVCDLLSKDKWYPMHVIITWFGNLVGTCIVATLEKLTRNSQLLYERAIKICEMKLNDNLISIFILSVFCNMLIFLAIKGYSQNYNCAKYLPILLGVTVFILCGFEHCVANMYYFTIAEVWNKTSLLYLIIMTLGNAIGGIAMSELIKIKEEVAK